MTTSSRIAGVPASASSWLVESGRAPPLRRLAVVVAVAGLLWMAAMVFYSTSYLILASLTGPVWLNAGISATLALFAFFMVWYFRNLAERVATWFGSRSVRMSGIAFLATTILVGLGLRLVWVGYFHGPLTSDGGTYYRLAQSLLTQGSYVDPRGDHAYWPPGYPLLLYAMMQVVGLKTWIPIALNLLAYAVTSVAVWGLASRWQGAAVARAAVVILALWPNLIFSTGVASKELVLMPLIAVFAWLLLSARQGGNSLEMLRYLAVGALVGYATLIQPAMLVLWGIILVDRFLADLPLKQRSGQLLVTLLAMALVVAPWTLRNHAVFGKPVLVSTNGGDVFYRANNPVAHGGYLAAGPVDLRAYGELERSEAGYALGKAWIRDNPLQFLALAGKKQMLFLGDDASGAYEALQRALDITDARYLVAKAVSNLYWLALWVVILMAILRGRWRENPLVWVAISATALVFLAVDSVFESGGRHHIPLAALLAVIASTNFSAEASTNVR